MLILLNIVSDVRLRIYLVILTYMYLELFRHIDIQ